MAVKDLDAFHRELDTVRKGIQDCGLATARRAHDVENLTGVYKAGHLFKDCLCGGASVLDVMVVGSIFVQRNFDCEVSPL